LDLDTVGVTHSTTRFLVKHIFVLHLREERIIGVEEVRLRKQGKNSDIQVIWAERIAIPNNCASHYISFSQKMHIGKVDIATINNAVVYFIVEGVNIHFDFDRAILTATIARLTGSEETLDPPTPAKWIRRILEDSLE